ncbi:SOS response-associated peptidase family protein [Paraburkholderia ginsengisoli]|uniref:SOS response-associated peptidase family protein n=1 Tax=Paraburkholderia ginsengisoli TaxID=311231 RepID=A0A7T4N9U4_9BURK|nr:SOS response-associated peptidase family protein [Paraburkholderia ginsengisoli]QQC67885.1 SOS response-associated peptidase family protein [Paraburkholderia ginsengisoli]
MCYSAQIEADYKKYVKLFGAVMSLREFAELYWEHGGRDMKAPLAMEAAFSQAQTDDERHIQALIAGNNAQRATRLEQEVFEQRTRLARAERTLEAKPTKAAAESRRIATNRIDAAVRRLADLKRTTLKDADSRIYPGWYAPVLIVQDGRRVVVPMRYRCRLPGWTEEMEKEKPGTYNARRNNLRRVWGKLFGYNHGIMIVNRFYEHVDRKGEKLILQFDPTPPQQMLVACLWSRTAIPGEPDLWSFAAVTDEPPPEVAAAGHDRCIIPIKPANVDAWLSPDPTNLAAQYAILDDRERPYYEHRMAA